MRGKYLLIAGLILISVSAFMLYREIALPKVAPLELTVGEMKEISQMEIDLTATEEEEIDHEFEEYLSEKYSKPEAAVEYLFATIMNKDINNYPNAFTSEQYSQDIFKDNEELDKTEVIKGIMNKLSRNGSLTSIEVIKGMTLLDRDSTRVVTDLTYSDLSSPVRVNLKVRKVEHEHLPHGDHDHHAHTEYYYIDSSVWELIQRIEDGG